jgi:hypothetical protein
MKNIRILSFSLLIFVVPGLGSCGSAESSNEKSGDTTKIQDSSLLNNYNNDYPNDRIHMKDSNAASDSSNRTDSIKK